MAQDDTGHAVPVDPIDPERGIDFRPVVLGEEAVALQSARRHQYDDAKRRVAEAEAVRGCFGEEPDHRVDQVDFLIDVLQSANGFSVARKVLPAPYPVLMQTMAEIVVARHATPAGAHQINHGKIDPLAITLERLQRAWI